MPVDFVKLDFLLKQKQGYPHSPTLWLVSNSTAIPRDLPIALMLLDEFSSVVFDSKYSHSLDL